MGFISDMERGGQKMTKEEAIEAVKTWYLPMVKTHADNDFAMEFIQAAHILALNALKDNGRCDTCRHLIVYNIPELYAVCERSGITFKPFDIDTRKTRCSVWEDK